MSGPSTKTPDAAEEGIGATLLNVTQHLFHIYDGGAAFADAPFNHGGDPISAPGLPPLPANA